MGRTIFHLYKLSSIFLFTVYAAFLYGLKTLKLSYKDFKISYVTKATYDEKVYICMTRLKSIMEKRTPCQSVSNKLGIEAAPKQLQNLRKLEKVLISERNCSKKLQ